MCLKICDKCEVNQISDTLSTLTALACVPWRDTISLLEKDKKPKGTVVVSACLVVIVASASVSYIS